MISSTREKLKITADRSEKSVISISNRYYTAYTILHGLGITTTIHRGISILVQPSLLLSVMLGNTEQGNMTGVLANVSFKQPLSS